MKLMSNLSIFGTQSKWNIKENTMVTTLTVVMLVLSTTGSVTKQTMETVTKKQSQCLAAQEILIKRKVPANVKLISVTCSTIGRI